MKTPPKQSQSPNKKPSNRKMLLFLILFIVVACLITYITYNKHQTNAKNDQAFQADKTRFAQVETDMKTAYDAMVAAAGKPDVSNVSKSCSRVSLKFQEGQLGCGITYSTSYNIDNYEGAVSLLGVLGSVINHDAFKLTSDFNAEQYTDKQSTSYQQEQPIELGLNHSSGMMCKIRMDIDQSQDTMRKTAHYSFSCYSDTKQPIYPLAQ